MAEETTQTDDLGRFEGHLVAEDWKSAVEEGKKLVDRTETEGVQLSPEQHYSLHNNLGIAYWQAGEGDAVFESETDRVRDYHSMIHLRKAIKIARQNGFDDRADRTEELLGKHLGHYILIAERTRET